MIFVHISAIPASIMAFATIYNDLNDSRYSERYLQEEELEKVKMVAVTVTDSPQVSVCFHLSGLAYSS